MDRLLKTNGFQTFLVLFSPFLFSGILMFGMSGQGMFNNNLFMFAGLFYVYPQIFILTYWPYYVSNKINDELDEKENLKGLRTRFKIAKSIIIGCLIGGFVNIGAMYFGASESIMKILTIATLPFNIGQIFILINLLMGFYSLSKMIELKTSGLKEGSGKTLVLFFFMPFTIGIIQSKIRSIFTKNENTTTQHYV
jgi:hypothetical protein